MELGAFAMIDCLGWKGIWKDFPKNPEIVLKKVGRIKRHAKEVQQTFHRGFSALNHDTKINLRFLSDTIVLSVADRPPAANAPLGFEKHGPALSVELLSIFVSDIINEFIEERPYLTVRGYITHGEYSLRDNFILGPAVDEAAENYEIADGAFVWLPPRLMDAWNSLQESREKFVEVVELMEGEQRRGIEPHLTVAKMDRDASLYITDYEMPLKNGRTLDCALVNPFYMVESGEERAELFERYEESFRKPGLDILLKKQNTFKFLSVASDASRMWYEENFDRNILIENMEKIIEAADSLKNTEGN